MDITKPFAWSYSALSDFKLCPLKLRETRLTKRFSDRNAANIAGTDDHKAFENRMLKGTPLPPQLRKYEPAIERFSQLPGQPSPELELAITEAWEPTGWFAKNAWGRAKIDLAITNKEKERVILLDWKFGKWRGDDRWLQLKIAAVMYACHFPEIETFDSAFVWVTQKFDVEPFRLTGMQVRDAQAEITAHVMEYREAYENDDFPPKQNFLCKKHCPVWDCPYNGGGKK